jgi:hypothetical protein
MEADLASWFAFSLVSRFSVRAWGLPGLFLCRRFRIPAPLLSFRNGAPQSPGIT